MNSLLSVKNLNIKYGRREIIRDVSFEVKRGQLVGLLGLNGCGKTTILKGVAGLKESDGDISADGKNTKLWSAKERAQYISHIPQHCSMNISLPALEIVMMGFNAKLKLLENPSRAHREEALRILKKISCEGLAFENFESLSQGQKQLILMARCLVQDAPLMLLDEPDSALDYLNKHLILSKIKELISADQRAALITLHDPNFAMAYCDRLVLIKDGEKAAELDVAVAGTEEVETGMSLIYGKVKILQFEGKYMMVRGDDCSEK